MEPSGDLLRKRFLGGRRQPYERDGSNSGRKAWLARVKFEGSMFIPSEDIYFDCGGVKSGFEICEDAWVATVQAACWREKGWILILTPARDILHLEKLNVRKRLCWKGRGRLA